MSLDFSHDQWKESKESLLCDNANLIHPCPDVESLHIERLLRCHFYIGHISSIWSKSNDISEKWELCCNLSKTSTKVKCPTDTTTHVDRNRYSYHEYQNWLLFGHDGALSLWKRCDNDDHDSE
jgi:hypothetical protein